MQKLTIPGSVGAPLSAATVIDGIIYTSGHVGADRETGRIAEGFGDQMHCAMRNLQTTLEASGGSLETIAKALIFVTDSSYFDEMNATYREYIASPVPARSTIVTALADPTLLFEIEVVAHVLEPA
ncbi:MAG: RidA family protein [Actinobacteria bacterium]|nr:RidA family protein [Actinomycetota bacterium]